MFRKWFLTKLRFIFFLEIVLLNSKCNVTSNKFWETFYLNDAFENILMHFKNNFWANALNKYNVNWVHILWLNCTILSSWVHLLVMFAFDRITCKFVLIMLESWRTSLVCHVSKPKRNLNKYLCFDLSNTLVHNI